MLFDPNWRKPTVEDFLKPHLLLQWLETQPPRKTYNFFDQKKCVLAQYLTHCGFSGCDVEVDLGLLPVDGPWYGRVVSGLNADDEPVYTFGAATERCRKFTAP